MERIALIRHGVVENVIDADLAFARGLGYDQVLVSALASPGDLLQENGELVRPETQVPPPNGFLSLEGDSPVAVGQPVALGGKLTGPDGVTPAGDRLLVLPFERRDQPGAAAVLVGCSVQSGRVTGQVTFDRSGDYVLSQAGLDARLPGERLNLTQTVLLTVYQSA